MFEESAVYKEVENKVINKDKNTIVTSQPVTSQNMNNNVVSSSSSFKTHFELPKLKSNDLIGLELPLDTLKIDKLEFDSKSSLFKFTRDEKDKKKVKNKQK